MHWSILFPDLPLKQMMGLFILGSGPSVCKCRHSQLSDKKKYLYTILLGKKRFIFQIIAYPLSINTAHSTKE